MMSMEGSRGSLSLCMHPGTFSEVGCISLGYDVGQGVVDRFRHLIAALRIHGLVAKVAWVIPLVSHIVIVGVSVVVSLLG